MHLLTKILHAVAGLFERQPHEPEHHEPERPTDRPPVRLRDRTFEEIAAELDIRATENNAKTGEVLAWRTSIVDLLKLLGFDWSLATRREMAEYEDDTRSYSGTADDNRWLAERVIDHLRDPRAFAEEFGG